MSGQRHAPATPYPEERPGTHCTRGWVGLRAGLDRCGKSRPHRDSIPGPAVAVPTKLPGPQILCNDFSVFLMEWLAKGIRGYSSVIAALKFTYFYNKMNNVLLKTIAELLYLTTCLIYMTVRTSNSENSCPHQASDNRFN